MKSALAAGLLATMAIAVPANAGTIQVVSGAHRWFAPGAFGNTAGQSFTSVDTNLTSFGFQLVALPNPIYPNVPFVFTLREGAGLNGAILATRTFTPPTSIGSTPTWYDIDITGTTVALGGIYTATLTSESWRYGPAMGPDINIYTGQELSGDAYTGGRAYFTQEVYPNCALTGNCDLNFRVTGTSATGAVPEPNTWAMLMLGFGAVGGTLRRRARVRFAQIAAT